MKESKTPNSMDPVFPVALDLRGQPGGLGHALQAQLRKAIAEGRLHAGMRLPSTRKAASALGIGRNTVIAAYDRLIAEGYIIARLGAAPEVAALRALPSRKRQATLPKPSDHFSARSSEGVSGLGGAEAVAVGGFRTGMPDARHFPHARWRQLMQRSLRGWGRKDFTYPPTEGVPELREAIARHVAFTRAVACDAGDVIVTSGATQAFDLLARVFVEPGRSRVAVEWPGYPPLARAFDAAGAKLVPVAVDGEGLRVSELPRDIGVVCVTPSHQSPLGVMLSQPRRGELLEHADRHDFLVVEDDYDGEFRYGARPLDALQSLDTSGRVFYVGTFSKSMFPSVRMGFIIAPRWARDALIAAKRLSDPHANDVLQAALAAFINEGDLARHVRRMQRLYAERRGVILDALAGPLSLHLDVVPSEAGLHLAAHLLDIDDERRIIAAATQYLPGITTIAHYSQAPQAPQAPQARSGLLFGFGCLDAKDAAKHMQAFSNALREKKQTKHRERI